MFVKLDILFGFWVSCLLNAQYEIRANEFKECVWKNWRQYVKKMKREGKKQQNRKGNINFKKLISRRVEDKHMRLLQMNWVSQKST